MAGKCQIFPLWPYEAGYFYNELAYCWSVERTSAVHTMNVVKMAAIS